MSAHQIAYFITPHGFGHATRAAAIMTAAQALDPSVQFEIFTRVPQWLFQQSLNQSLNAPFGYHDTLTDIGLAQKNALHEDIAETVRRLDAMLPFDPDWIGDLARQVVALGCQLVVCDVAPLGIAVARAAGVPSVLIENFTWDWIYESYRQDAAGLAPHIAYLQDLFARADYRIQTEPVCRYVQADIITTPVSRIPRTAAPAIRERLGVPTQSQLVLVTMGGLSTTNQHTFLDRLAEHTQAYFILPGMGDTVQIQGNVVRLPHQSHFYHPDIMHAADAVVGKTGYSTVAEAYHAGAPYGYVSRPRFPESAVMAAFIQSRMRGIEFSEAAFHSGQWLDRLPELLSLGHIPRVEPNGAEQVAQFLLKL